MIEPTIHVGDFDREAIEEARRTPSEDKLREGLRLFNRTCRIMSAGIQHERPDADPSEVLRVLRERVRLARSLERR